MLLELDDLHAGYGRTDVLHGVSLRVATGEAVGVIGPNGAGKSTVLRAIFGLATVQRGRIRFQGADILHEPTHQLLAKGIAYVPQGRLVFPSLTVEENLRMGGYTLPTHAEVDRRLEDLFERFPALLTLRRRRAGECSGGQQQLVAITRALMVSPALLLLDEPSLGLSPAVCAETYAAIDALRVDGVSVVIVEQNVHLVLRHTDRVLALVAGEIRAEGPPAEFADAERLRTLFFGAETERSSVP